MFPHAQRQPLMIALSFLGSTARRPCTNRSDASHVKYLGVKTISRLSPHPSGYSIFFDIHFSLLPWLSLFHLCRSITSTLNLNIYFKTLHYNTIEYCSSPATQHLIVLTPKETHLLGLGIPTPAVCCSCQAHFANKLEAKETHNPTRQELNSNE